MRLLLTMLALLAGFAAAPASARMTPAETAELERVEGGRSSSAIAAAAADSQAQARGERRERERTRTRRPASVIVLIPSIQYGDRALE